MMTCDRCLWLWFKINAGPFAALKLFFLSLPGGNRLYGVWSTAAFCASTDRTVLKLRSMTSQPSRMSPIINHSDSQRGTELFLAKLFSANIAAAKTGTDLNRPTLTQIHRLTFFHQQPICCLTLPFSSVIVTLHHVLTHSTPIYRYLFHLPPLLNTNQ